MHKKSNILIISGAVVCLFLLIYFFGLNRDKSYVTDNWIETYNPKDKGPYGTYVMKELLDTVGLFSTFIELDSKIEESLIDNEDVNDIYFFIGKTNHITDESIENLIEFVENGNTAFIAAEKMPAQLNDYFFLDTKNMYLKEKDSIQFFNFEHQSIAKREFKFEYINNNERKVTHWKYFKPNNFELWNDNQAFTLGTIQNNKANFIKIQYGDGALYFHSNPYAFTNVCMLKEDGFEYAENMLKHIPAGQVQWDKYNLNYHYIYEDNDSNTSGNGGDSRSMLEFIFKNKALTWAFVLLLIMALLYAIFKGKRMQDIVKPAEDRENTSLQYIETISSLYLQEKKHGKLITLKERTFLNYIAEHYYLSTTKATEEFIQKLSFKSQIETEHIKDIFAIFDNFRNHDIVSDEMLIELHRRIEYFYKHCK